MSDNSSMSEQRAKIVQPRTAPEAEAMPLSDLESKDLEEPAQQAPFPDTEESKKPKLYPSFEDLPEDVRTEFTEWINRRAELVAYFERKGMSDPENLTGRVHEMLVKTLMSGVPVLNQRAFSYGIAGNLLLEAWKKRRIKAKGKGRKTAVRGESETITVQDILTDPLDLERDVDAVEFDAFNEAAHIKSLLQHCTRTLTPYQIAVFYLHSICDLTYEEISWILDRTPNALRGCHKQAVDKIQADAIGIADLRLAARHSSYSEEDTRTKAGKIAYAVRAAAARKRFGSRK